MTKPKIYSANVPELQAESIDKCKDKHNNAQAILILWYVCVARFSQSETVPQYMSLIIML